MEGGSSHVEANDRTQITDLLTAVELDADKFANFRQPHAVPIRLKEKISACWTLEWGGSPNSES